MNDIRIGVFSYDVIKDLASSLIHRSEDKSVTKIEAVLMTLMTQKSFYPLYPPKENASIDLTKLSRMTFEESPDVLILPSDLAHFAKVSQLFITLFSKSTTPCA